MTTGAIADEVAAREPMGKAPQPRHLIVTVYGLYARESDGWLSVAALVSLLADLEVDEPAVRSSISRLKRRGILVASKRGGAAGYELSAEAREILREGDERIFGGQRAALSDGWVLATFSVPESDRHKRHVLRSQLTKLGFGNTAPGVWIAPAHLRAATISMLERYELSGYADVFHAEHKAFGALPDKVAQWWDLEQLATLYEEFLQVYVPVQRRWRRRRTPKAQEAFADYVRALTDWRRLPYLDPGLPAELLPRDWVGMRATELFFALREDLAEHAHAHVTELVSGQAG